MELPPRHALLLPDLQAGDTRKAGLITGMCLERVCGFAWASPYQDIMMLCEILCVAMRVLCSWGLVRLLACKLLPAVGFLYCQVAGQICVHVGGFHVCMWVGVHVHVCVSAGRL